MHFCVEVNLGDFARLVAEPALDLHKIKAGTQPIRRRRFAKSVKIMLSAYWARLACNLDFMSIIVSAFPNLRLALSAIQPGALCNRFEFAEEVPLGFSVFVGEDPAARHRVLLVVGQQ